MPMVLSILTLDEWHGTSLWAELGPMLLLPSHGWPPGDCTNPHSLCMAGSGHMLPCTPDLA